MNKPMTREEFRKGLLEEQGTYKDDKDALVMAWLWYNSNAIESLLPSSNSPVWDIGGERFYGIPIPSSSENPSGWFKGYPFSPSSDSKNVSEYMEKGDTTSQMCKCPDCDGTTYDEKYGNRVKCKTCKGTGKVPVEKEDIDEDGTDWGDWNPITMAQKEEPEKEDVYTIKEILEVIKDVPNTVICEFPESNIFIDHGQLSLFVEKKLKANRKEGK